jgi:serine/threonine protein kinase
MKTVIVPYIYSALSRVILFTFLIVLNVQANNNQDSIQLSSNDTECKKSVSQVLLTSPRVATEVNNETLLKTIPSTSSPEKTQKNFSSVLRMIEDQTKTSDEFEVIREIATGGMGKVFLIRHKTIGIDIVYKIPLEKDGDKIAPLEYEVQILKDLHHPNILKLYKAFSHDSAVKQELDGAFFEYIKGGSLQDFFFNIALDEKRPLENIDRFIDYMKQLSEGLEYLNQKNIVHLDLKPDNIMITEYGEIKIIDFGIAYNRNTPDIFKRGKSHIFSSPEQIKFFKDGVPFQIDQRSDLFSLGKIIFRFLNEIKVWRTYNRRYLYTKEEADKISHLRMIAFKLTDSRPEKRWPSAKDIPL